MIEYYCDHTFKYDDNFAVTQNGSIKMLDYGALDVKKILELYPKEERSEADGPR
ncbi:MAG TPA: hypothetical protein VJC06_00990 [Candidatus Paceibacterota bacterium]